MEFSINEQQFCKTILQASTPVLVHFWAPWCGLCRFIMPQLNQFQTDWQGQVQVIGINADQSLKLASKYQLRNLPTLILFDQGKVLHRIEHIQGRDDLRRSLDQVMQDCVEATVNSSLEYAEAEQSQTYLTLEA